MTPVPEPDACFPLSLTHVKNYVLNSHKKTLLRGGNFAVSFDPEGLTLTSEIKALLKETPSIPLVFSCHRRTQREWGDLCPEGTVIRMLICSHQDLGPPAEFYGSETKEKKIELEVR